MVRVFTFKFCNKQSVGLTLQNVPQRITRKTRHHDIKVHCEEEAEALSMSTPLALRDVRDKKSLGGGSNICFMFIPIFGEMIQFDEHIFQMG